MYRRGHVGVALLAYAPLGYLLATAGFPALAILGLPVVLAVEPLPDNDFWIPGLSHRGVSHSLVAALVVGAALAGVGYLLGEQLVAPIADSLVEMSAGVPVDEAGRELAAFDGPMLALCGFVAGAYGILCHLLGDVITVSGIRPLLPFSEWRISVSGIRADSWLANGALAVAGVLGIGVAAVAVVA